MVELIWATPDGDNLVGYLARVSNVKAKLGDPSDKLIKYLIDNKHWSPFEMVSACVEINTTRDISHQLVRHRSFSFQEFSGRYSGISDLVGIGEFGPGGVGEHWRELRLQDHKNRQNSLDCDNPELHTAWKNTVGYVAAVSKSAYDILREQGVAKEVVRSLLPEGFVPSKVYMSGNLRSWIHYWGVRCSPATQKEHRLVAEQTREVILNKFPGIAKAIEYAK